MKNLHWWLVLACVPLYGFWTMPYLSETRPVLQKSIQVENKKSAGLDKKIAALRSQVQELSAESNKPTEAIPVVLEQEYLMLDLRRLTQGNGFSSKSFSFSKGQNLDTKSAQMTATFSAEGNKKNLVKLLESIEANRRFLGLNELSFGVSSASDDLINISLNLYALAQSL